MKVFVDTNAVIWLYQGEVEKFTDKCKELLESNDILVSPVVRLELQYLFELKRLKTGADRVIASLHRDIGLILHDLPLRLLIEQGMKETWTRDPFDRLICAHAAAEEGLLVTKDETIHRHYKRAFW